MTSPNLECIQRIYRDFAAGNIEGVLASMSPDIVWREANNFPYADRSPYVGPQAVLEGVFVRCATEWDGFSVEVDELLDAGDAIVALGRYRGSTRRQGAPRRPRSRTSGGSRTAASSRSSSTPTPCMWRV